MADYGQTASAFREMAHRIVWCSVATVGEDGRPRTRVLHPIWEWEGERLVGWIATGPTPVKRAHLEHTPFVSCSYWSPSQDTCSTECEATWHLDDETREWLWAHFAGTPAPLGYDPAIIPGWDRPTAASFAALRLDPYRLRVFPGALLMGQGGEVLTWSEPSGG